MPPRIEPFTTPYTAEVQRQLDGLMGGAGREPLNLFRTLVHNSGLTDGFAALGGHNLSRGTLPVRHRELMILRTTALCGCEYEWGVHARIFAKAAQLTPDELALTASESPASSFTGAERLVIQIADELHGTSTVSTERMDQALLTWTPAQVLELLEVAGFYHLVSFVANGAAVALEEWAARFPEGWLASLNRAA
jgi:4-carboxymuconolactone decarboxylase